jgi:Domain of unknown function (DUF4304)
MSAQQIFTSAIAVAGSVLKQRGFRRRGSKFTRMGGEVVSLIEFQRNRDSTAAYLTFVINYGVAVLSLAHAEGVDTAKLWWTQCHWRARVSGKDGHESWWPVRDEDDPDKLGARLTHLVERDVLPALEEKQREADLVTLWTTGKSPGLVEARRLLCLAQLLHRAGRQAEALQTRVELEHLPQSPFTLRASQKLKELEEQAGRD